jgi:hypothetical protein
MSPLLIKISKDLKLVCCPRFDSCAPAHVDLSVCPAMSLAPRGSILAPTLVTLPSMSLNPSAPVETHSLPSLARRYPRDFTFYVADPLSSICDSLHDDGSRHVIG